MASNKAPLGPVKTALLAAAGLGISALVVTTVSLGTVYSKGVDQVLSAGNTWVNRNVRIEGTMINGSLKFREQPCEYRFSIMRNNMSVEVHYATCVKPDTLRDDMPDVGVTAEGKLTPQGYFEASNVLAKCPSKYEGRTKQAIR